LARVAKAAILGAVVTSLCAGCTQSTSTANTGESLGPRALLRQMVETYRTATSYEDVGELHILPQNAQQDDAHPFAVAFERPNKIRVHSLGAMIVADGQNLRAVAPSLDEQVLSRPCEAPLSLEDFSSDELLVQAMRGRLGAGLPQLMLLLDEAALDAITADAELEQLPDAELHGETCHRVAVKGADGAAVYWIAPESHVLVKLEFPMNSLREHFPLAAVWVEFKGARVGREINPLAFQMEVPPTAKLVKKFILPPPPALPPLLGQSPGDFQFVDLDGQQVERESLAGKVVVLDLWATWCGWCFEGLPLLESVYQKYKDDDRVVILAVSKDETAVSNERVRQSFAEHKLTIPVVRDLQQVSDSVFQVQALPTSVVLGTDGTVQDYHVGFDAQLAETMPQKIEKLLAGENVAQQTIDAHRQAEKEYQDRLAEVAIEPTTGGEASEIAEKPSTVK
jgi:thiol-disulfide isomerase/thioredoxin/outer membrane lipoprotein-sorting protein